MSKSLAARSPLPIAILEAKKEDEDPVKGMQQAKGQPISALELQKIIIGLVTEAEKDDEAVNPRLVAAAAVV